MRLFVTGASGWIGSAVVPELITAGHEVVGLARSDASAEALLAAGAKVRRGGLADPDALGAAAAESDGVIHLAYHHDFSDLETAVRLDMDAIEAMGTALAGSDRPLLTFGGTAALVPGELRTERDEPDRTGFGAPRAAAGDLTLSFAERGVRSVYLRLAPTVHGAGDPGFMAYVVAAARKSGVAGYVGDGGNRWPAVHRADAARLIRLAVEKAPAGSVLHGVGEEGVRLGAVAEVIGRELGVPVEALSPERAAEHFGWLAGLLGRDGPASSELTRQLLDWRPTGPGLLDDLPNYVAQPPTSA